MRSIIRHISANDTTIKANYIQGDSVARGPKLFSIKNYVIEVMT